MSIPSTLKHKDGTPCAGKRCAFIFTSGHEWAGDVILHVDQSRFDPATGWRTMIVTANEDGYDEGPVIAAESSQYDNTRATVDRYNAERGYTADQVRDIITSSMFGAKYPREEQTVPEKLTVNTDPVPGESYGFFPPAPLYLKSGLARSLARLIELALETEAPTILSGSERLGLANFAQACATTYDGLNDDDVQPQ